MMLFSLVLLNIEYDYTTILCSLVVQLCSKALTPVCKRICKRGLINGCQNTIKFLVKMQALIV